MACIPLAMLAVTFGKYWVQVSIPCIHGLFCWTIRLHLPLVGELSTASVCGDLTFSGLPCTSCVFLAMLAITFGKHQVYVSDSLAFSDLPRISVSDCYAGGGGNSHLVSIGSMHPIHLDFIDSDYSENIHMLITTLRLRLRIYFCLDCLLRYIRKCAQELGDCE